MKAIKIVEANAQEIEAALKSVNGAARQHAYTAAHEIESLADNAEGWLSAFGLPKKLRVGAKWAETSGDKVAKAYGKKGFSRIATRVTLERRSTGWFLIDAKKIEIGEAGGGSFLLTLTAQQDAEVMRRLRAQYQVAA